MFNINVDQVGIYECKLVTDWSFPIGEEIYIPEMWYAASLHSLDGSLNNGYRHSGIDINLDNPPWGDTERVLGLSMYAVTKGKVEFITNKWSGVPMLVINTGKYWIRYAHIIPIVKLGEEVQGGDKLGGFADYYLGGGGDHLHLDMATSKFTTEWLDKSVEWVDPVIVLKAHLDSDLVDLMLKKD